MGRMFKTITRTWNPFTGCLHDCTYCWARKLATGKLKDTAKYRENGFAPTFHPGELKAKFKPGEFVFVSSMGDIGFANNYEWEAIFRVIRSFPETKFLIQTKSPMLFLNNWAWPSHVYHGTTIETNRKYEDLSKAPPVTRRYHDMEYNPHLHKFLSIEPVMDFDLETLVCWIKDIRPEIVEVGADNYHNNLPEPPWEKVQQLLEALRHFVPQVIEKDGLTRLRVGGNVAPAKGD